MANADISLLFGVLGDGSLSGESGTLIQSQLTQIITAINKNPLKIKVALDTEASGQKSWNSQLQAKLNTISASGKFSVKISKIELGASAITDFKNQLNAVIHSLHLDSGTTITLNAKGIGEITTQFKQAGTAANQAKSDISAVIKEINATNRRLGTLYSGTKAKLISPEELQSANTLRAKFLELESASEHLRANRATATQEDIQNVYRLQDELKKLIAAIQEEQAAAKTAAQQSHAAESSRIATLKEITAAYQKLNTYISKNPRIAGTIQGDRLISMRDRLYEIMQAGKEANSAIQNITQADLQNMLGQMSQMQIALKASGKEGKSLGGIIGSAYSRFGGWMLVTHSLMSVMRDLKQMVINVQEIDTAMTELKKVTDETDATYRTFLSNAATRSKELGTTIADIVTATADFARLGYNIDEATMLADAATVYKNVGDGIEDISTASQSIISTMKAFGIETSDAMLVVDKFNEVGNNFAISSKGIGDALVRSAAALSSAGNDLDESIALVTAANNVVQDPDKVGTALKTVSMFLRAAKTEAAEAGESTDGMANSVSELREELLALTGGKVDIQLDETTFKSTYQILKEISGVWEELTDITQANILEMIGGKRNSNVVASLLTNFDTAEKVLATSMGAAGSALAENEKYLDSINGKLAQFQAAFEELSTTAIQSEFLKDIIDAGTSVLEILTEIIDTLGLFPTLLSAITASVTLFNSAKGKTAGIFSLSDTNQIAILGNSLSELSQRFQLAKDSGQGFADAIGLFFDKSFFDANGNIAEYNRLLDSSTQTQSIFMQYMESTDSTLAKYLKSLNGGKASLQGYREYCKSAGVETQALGIKSKAAAVGVTALNMAFNMLLAMGISLLLQGIVSGISAIANASRNASEAANEAAESSREMATANAEELQTLLALIDQYQSLRSKEFTDAATRADIRDIQSEITNLVGSQADSLDLVNGKLDEQIQKLKTIAQQQAGDTVDSYVASYQAAAEALRLAVGEDDGSFAHPAIGAWDYIGARDKAAEQILEAAGYQNYVDSGGWFGNTTYISTALLDKNAEERAQTLLGMMEALKNAANYDYTNSKLFSTLRKQYEAYLEYGTELSKQAQGLLDSVVYEASLQTGQTSFDSLDAFAAYRQNLIDTVSASEDLSAAMQDGSINIDAVTQSVDDLMARDFPEWYQELSPQLTRDKQLGALMEKLVSDADAYSDKAAAIKENLSQLSDEDLQLAYNIIVENDGVATWDELIAEIERYKAESNDASKVSERLKETLRATWASEEFGDTKKELIELSQTVNGITPDAIIELAGKSESLAQILSENGMNAQFLAKILQSLSTGGHGIDFITEDALKLNEALDGMVRQFDKVTDAKSRYDAAMSVEEKDLDFRSYAEAFDELNSQFEAGTTNSNAFWAAAEFLFGKEQLTDWGWSDGLDEIYAAMEKNKLVFSDADSAGAGFIDRLYRMSEAGELVNEKGEKLLSISKDATGAFDFDIDPQNLDEIAKKMGITEEAALACLKALSMWGDIDFYDLSEVEQVIEEIGLSAEFAGKKAINISALADQLITLGKTDKEIYDIISGLQKLDGVTLFDAASDIDTVKQSLLDLQLASQNGVNVSVNAEGLATLMSQLQFTKEDAQALVTKLGEADNITLTNASGEVQSISDALRYIDTLDFATVTGNADGVSEAIDGVNTASTDNAVTQMENIGTAADIAASKVENIQTKMNSLNGTKSVVTIEVQRKAGLLGALLPGFANGTNKAPAGDALVGEEAPELIQSGNQAYLAGTDGPEIVHLEENDRVYTADETEKIMRRSGKHITGTIPAYANGRVSTGGLRVEEDKKGSVGTPYKIKLDEDIEGDLKDALDKLKEEIDGIIGDFEHQIFLGEHRDASVQEIVSIYKKMQEAVHAQAVKFREMGEDENSDYIQELQKQWFEFGDKIKEIVNQNFEDARSEMEGTIRLSQNLMDNAVAKGGTQEISNAWGNANDIIDQYKFMQASIHEQAELYRQAGYEETSKEITDLKNQWWDVENSIAEVRKTMFEASITDFENANQLSENGMNSAISGGDFEGVKKFTNDVIDRYRFMQQAVHDQAEYYRRLGYADTSEEVSALSSLWWDYQEIIKGALENGYSAYIADMENAVTLTENWLDRAMAGGDLKGVQRYAGDMVSYYQKMQEAVHNQAESYRNLGYSNTSTEVSELSDAWYDYQESIEDVKQSVVDSLVDMVTASSDAVSEMTGVLDTLKNAANEYAENGGYISVDAFQAIVELGPEYMQYLRDENGLLVINEESINRVIAAKTQQLALDNAMSYVERLRLALQADSIEDLNQLLTATTQSTDATWGLVYANLALLDLNSDQYQAALHNINAIRSLADTTVKGLGQAAGNFTDSLTDMQDGLDSILDYVMDMLRQRIEDQVDALEDMKDAYAELISLKKESLEASKEETDYQDTVADKIKEIAKLQERINMLSLDDSRDAQAQKAKLEEELADLQKELSDTQSDYAYDQQVDALDKMQEAYEKEKDGEIDALEESISSTQKLYDMAIAYIEEHWSTLKDELIAWNYDVGNTLEKELVEAWDNAYAAAQRYGSYVSALNHIGGDIDKIESGDHNTVGESGNYGGPSNVDMIRQIVKQMKGYSAQWSFDNSDAMNNVLREKTTQLAAKLDQYGVHAEYDPASGTWTITKDRQHSSNVGKLLYDCYHSGGIVGGTGSLKDNEVMAILEKGEAVLDKTREEGLYRLIDFVTVISKKFENALSGTALSGFLQTAKGRLPELQTAIPETFHSQTDSIHFGDVYIYGSGEETVEKHREINRQFTNDVLRYLHLKR